MRFAGVTEIKNGLSRYLARARKRNEPIVVTHHGKPYALIQPLREGDLEALGWRELARRKLARAWEDEEDALYDYLQARPGCRRERHASEGVEDAAGTRYQRGGLPRNTARRDCPLAHWKTAGLRHPSTARIANILAVEES